MHRKKPSRCKGSTSCDVATRPFASLCVAAAAVGIGLALGFLGGRRRRARRLAELKTAALQLSAQHALVIVQEPLTERVDDLWAIQVYQPWLPSAVCSTRSFGPKAGASSLAKVKARGRASAEAFSDDCSGVTECTFGGETEEVAGSPSDNTDSDDDDGLGEVPQSGVQIQPRPHSTGQAVECDVRTRVGEGHDLTDHNNGARAALPVSANPAAASAFCSMEASPSMQSLHSWDSELPDPLGPPGPASLPSHPAATSHASTSTSQLPPQPAPLPLPPHTTARAAHMQCPTGEVFCPTRASSLPHPAAPLLPPGADGPACGPCFRRTASLSEVYAGCTSFPSSPAVSAAGAGAGPVCGVSVTVTMGNPLFEACGQQQQQLPPAASMPLSPVCCSTSFSITSASCPSFFAATSSSPSSTSFSSTTTSTTCACAASVTSDGVTAAPGSLTSRRGSLPEDWGWPASGPAAHLDSSPLQPAPAEGRARRRLLFTSSVDNPCFDASGDTAAAAPAAVYSSCAKQGDGAVAASAEAFSPGGPGGPVAPPATPPAAEPSQRPPLSPALAVAAVAAAAVSEPFSPPAGAEASGSAPEPHAAEVSDGGLRRSAAPSRPPPSVPVAAAAARPPWRPAALPSSPFKTAGGDDNPGRSPPLLSRQTSSPSPGPSSGPHFSRQASSRSAAPGAPATPGSAAAAAAARAPTAPARPPFRPASKYVRVLSSRPAPGASRRRFKAAGLLNTAPGWLRLPSFMRPTQAYLAAAGAAGVVGSTRGEPRGDTAWPGAGRVRGSRAGSAVPASTPRWR